MPARCLSVVIVGALNLMRSPTGRAFIAIRDSETAAKSMGIDIAAYKVKSFAISAAITGLAGSLYAHKLSFISPEMFTLLLSIEFVMVIIIGGAIGLHGAVLGAIFIVMVDPLLTWVKDDVPSFVAGFAIAWRRTGRAQSIEQTLAMSPRPPVSRAPSTASSLCSSSCSSRWGSTAAG